MADSQFDPMFVLEIDDGSTVTAPAPYIDSTTGNWFVYDAVQGQYVNSGVHAKGDQGDPGVITKINDVSAANIDITLNMSVTDGVLSIALATEQGDES